MARFLKSREESDGKSPGSLIFIGDQKMDSAKVRLKHQLMMLLLLPAV